MDKKSIPLTVNFKVQGSNEESETDDEDMKLFIESYNKYMKQHGLKHFDKLKFVRTLSI
jgi:hypothetical protein